MVMNNIHTFKGRGKNPVSFSNWEDDVSGIVLESCAADEDPSGYRVVYHKYPLKANVPDSNQYSIGGSYLKNRLEKLNRAGFDAPMTKKAINMLKAQK